MDKIRHGYSRLGTAEGPAKPWRSGAETIEEGIMRMDVEVDEVFDHVLRQRSLVYHSEGVHEGRYLVSES